MIHDRLLHRLVKLGPEGALTSALAALDIALWDLKGQLLGQPIWRLLGGAWRTALPFYSSIGGNGAQRSVDEVLRIVEARLTDKPAAIKIRFDNDRVDLDSEIPDHLAKARAVRKLVGDDFPLAFDANNGYTPGGAMRVGRVLEELGYWWFEEPVQHYHVRATGEVARETLDHRFRRRAELYPGRGGRSHPRRRADGAAGHRQDGRHHRDAPLRRARPGARRGVRAAPDAADDRPHGEPPYRRHAASRDQARELNDPSPRMHAVFSNPPRPVAGLFHLPTAPGLGLDIDEALVQRRVELPGS